MKNDKSKQIQKSGKKESSIVRSSAAGYLTFITATGKSGVNDSTGEGLSQCGRGYVSAQDTDDHARLGNTA